MIGRLKFRYYNPQKKGRLLKDINVDILPSQETALSDWLVFSQVDDMARSHSNLNKLFLHMIPILFYFLQCVASPISAIEVGVILNLGFSFPNFGLIKLASVSVGFYFSISVLNRVRNVQDRH